MDSLDFLEINLIKTISVCSIFTFQEVKYVYEKTESFDKTIACLKKAVESSISLKDAIIEVISK